MLAIEFALDVRDFFNRNLFVYLGPMANVGASRTLVFLSKSLRNALKGNWTMFNETSKYVA